MRRSPIPAALLAALLPGCSSEAVPEAFNAQAKADQQAARERTADAKAIGSGFMPAAPAPLETVSVDPPKTSAPGAILPPGDRQYRYIGRWAPSTELCRSGAWRFQTRSLAIAGKATCDLPTVAAVPSGYRLDGLCRAGGRKTPDILAISFDEPRRRMRVAGQTLGPIDLLYCGD